MSARANIYSGVRTLGFSTALVAQWSVLPAGVSRASSLHEGQGPLDTPAGSTSRWADRGAQQGVLMPTVRASAAAVRAA